MEIEYFDADIVQAIDRLSSLLLSYVGGFALLLLVATGVYYMTAQGDPDRQARAKNSFSYIMMGLILVMLSYGILEVIEQIAAE